MLPFETYIYDSVDPYRACHEDVVSHPRYLDCENCDHAKYGTCEYGPYLLKKLREMGKAEHASAFSAKVPPPIDPNFRLKYAPTA